MLIEETHYSYSTVDFVKRAIIYFGYKPKIIQTDNGAEFLDIIKDTKTKIYFCHPYCSVKKALMKNIIA